MEHLFNIVATLRSKLVLLFSFTARWYIANKMVHAAALIVLVLAQGCSSSYKNYVGNYKYTGTTNEPPNYSNMYYWAAHPAKWDPSDSVPTNLAKFKKDTSVDVFFIHPTTYTELHNLANQPNGGNMWNANIYSDSLNAQTDYTTILNQASVFNQYNVYAPRYRQAHIQSFYIPQATALPFFDTAYADVKNAFAYYMANYNHGKPFIIASHSQGTVHAGRLIKELIENTPLRQKLVAAYLIGMPVASNYFTNIPPCNNATQLGCVISWRSFEQGYTAPNIAKETFKAIVINPLTWNNDTVLASKALNAGSIFYKFNRIKKQNLSAQVIGNVLWCSKPKFFGSSLLKTKNYHIGDYNFFWNNIRNNAAERVAAYATKN
jgi:hypothetical protein